MSRASRHRYLDPLDQVWLATAAAIGLRVVRSSEVYASTDGRGTLALGDSASLDPDDCIAQMVLHELCHSLVAGRDAFALPDWGLDNTSARDRGHEHACLRLQAFLTGRHGLRRVLAPTTDHRAFYDQLGPDPFEPRTEPSSGAAILGAQRARRPPWAPHLERALEATGEIVRAASRFTPPAADLPPLAAAFEAPPGRHPLGGIAASVSSGKTCGDCAWRDRQTGECRQRGDVPAEPTWPACERHEPELDCLRCAACCRAAYHSVEVERDDPICRRHPDLIVDRGHYVELRRSGDQCAALRGDLARGLSCSIYQERPRTCREFEVGGEHCLTARRRLGLSL